MSLWTRIRSLFRRSKLDQEMAEEMRFHMESQETANRAAGMSADEARREARKQFGHTDSIEETCRDGRPFAWVDHLIRDIRFGLRMIVKSPGYTAVIVLTLAFGIAVNATIFGMLSLVFFEPAPFPAPERLVVVVQKHPTVNMPVGIAYPDFKEYRERTKTVTGLCATDMIPLQVSAEGKSPIRSWGQAVSPSMFADMGVAAELGRTLLPSDGETAGTAAVAVLSRGFWENHLAADPGIVGKTIRINGHPFTVVGIAANGFHGFNWGMDLGVFVPAGTLPLLYPTNGADQLDKRWATSWRLMGRLKPGVSLHDARAEFDVLGAQVAAAFPEEHKGTKVMLMLENSARPDPSISSIMPALCALFVAMVGLVLLIACANVANLMMARVLSRQKELVMRAALGATRLRLAAQLLVESVLVSLLAGVAGWYMSQFAGRMLGRFSPNSDIPIYMPTEVGWRVVVFTFAISIVAGVLTGIVPAWRASRVNLVEGLNESGGGRTTGQRHRLRNMLVLSQITSSCVVLIMAAVFLRSLQAIRSLDLGFNPTGVLLTSFDLSLQRFSEENGRAFSRDVLSRVRSLPGVQSACLTQLIPLDNVMRFGDLYPENPPAQLADGKTSAMTNVVDPAYFSTLGVRLLKGRTFTDDDRADTVHVAVVNAAMAEACWPGQDPIGKRFRRWKDGPWVQVVGVTTTGKYMMLTEAPRPAAYYAYAQIYDSPMTVAVRSNLDPAALATQVRDAIHSVNPDLPVFNVRTLDEHLRQSVFAFMPLRMGATVAGIQGLIALFLGVMGLYAVVAYGVTQRTREIGVRMALGATRAQVLKLVVRDSARLTIIGIGVGVLAAFGMTFLLSHVLYGAKPFDVVVYSGVVLVLIGVTALACFLPARRAIQINPVNALRHE
ncbi:hypothetical protein DB347_10390 [Opitutaceae bacterium EW11]|nr:hypothetical protein DB347_10390 [Opitutaceae bacterium EW11]